MVQSFFQFIEQQERKQKMARNNRRCTYNGHGEDSESKKKTKLFCWLKQASVQNVPKDFISTIDKNSLETFIEDGRNDLGGNAFEETD